MINRRYLLFELNTKHMSSNLLKISEFHEREARVKMLMFQNMKYTVCLVHVFTEKKVNFIFNLCYI